MLKLKTKRPFRWKPSSGVMISRKLSRSSGSGHKIGSCYWIIAFFWVKVYNVVFQPSHTGWSIRLYTTCNWHQKIFFVTVQPPYTKLQLSIWWQQNVVYNQRKMSQPSIWAAPTGCHPAPYIILRDPRDLFRDLFWGVTLGLTGTRPGEGDAHKQIPKIQVTGLSQKNVWGWVLPIYLAGPTWWTPCILPGNSVLHVLGSSSSLRSLVILSCAADALFPDPDLTDDSTFVSFFSENMFSIVNQF